jgi:hypothetical protein
MNKYRRKEPKVYWKSEGTCCSRMSINIIEICNKIPRLEVFTTNPDIGNIPTK